MNLKNTEISKFIKDHFLDENGVVYSTIDRVTEGIVTDKTVEGGQTPDWYKGYTLAEFWQYENSGMATGAYMNALCLNGAAEERRRTYNALKWIYDMGKQLEEGFIPKTYGGRFSEQTSTDQVLYVMSGMDAYYPLAAPEEKREIEHMIPMMTHFWVNRGYKYHYYYLKDMLWPPLRFPSFLVAAYHYSGDEIFKREADRILRENLDFFPENSKIFVRQELSDFERKNKVRIINQMADAVTMDVMNLDMLLRFEPGSEFAQIWLKGIETIWNEAKLTLHPDGKYGTVLFYDMSAKTARPPDPGDWQWQGTKSGWSTMVVRAGLMAEKYLPEQRDEIRVATHNVLSKLGPRDCTYYEDAENFPPEMRFKTRFLSGDSITNWLWAYELYQALNCFPIPDGKKSNAVDKK